MEQTFMKERKVLPLVLSMFPSYGGIHGSKFSL